MKKVNFTEDSEFTEVECIVEYMSETMVTLRYQYNNAFYILQLPFTEQNKHLNVGQNISMALGMKKQPEVSKKSLREIYEELRQHALNYIFTSGGVGANRKATAFAIKHTKEAWREQYEA